MSDNKNPRSQEGKINILYNRLESTLFGFIGLYESESVVRNDAQGFDRFTYPFAIGSFPSTKDGLIHVYGSVHFLLQEIHRLCREFHNANKSWWTSREAATELAAKHAADLLYNSHLMDFSILLSARARNIFHLFKKLRKQTIQGFSYREAQAGEVPLIDIFDVLIHSRYYYFDGKYINDVLSDKPPRRTKDSKKLMGRKILFQDFVDGVLQAISDVRTKDLTELLSFKLQELSADADEQDLIFLHQNVFSISELLKTKLRTPEFEPISQLISDRLGISRGDFGHGPISILFKPELGKSNFEIRVEYITGKDSAKRDGNDPREFRFDIEYRRMFHLINQSFGEGRLLTGFKFPVEI